MSDRRAARTSRQARSVPSHATALAHGMRITILHGDTASRSTLSDLWHARADRFDTAAEHQRPAVTEETA